MNERNWWGVIGGVLILLAAMSQLAQAKDALPPIPSGNLNLRIQGYEVVGSDQVNIRVIGQEIADSEGNFNGDETFTYVDGSADPTSTAVCNGSVTGGTITAQGGSFGTSGEGEFVITVPFTPATPVSGTACVEQTTTMQCERTLAHPLLVGDLDAGQYHCIVTSVSGTGIGGASMDGHLDSVAGSNSPTS